MSWQTYVDDHLMCEIDGHNLTAAAIIGHDGSVWAQSATFPQVHDGLLPGILIQGDGEETKRSQSLIFLMWPLAVDCKRVHLVNVKLKIEEVTGIMKDFADPGSLAPTGLYLGSTKYMVIQGETGAVIRGKKGSGGVTIKKTNQALVIGIYEEPLTAGQCNMIVERLGDYLIDQGI